jgi:hypothetical protein
MVNLRKILEYGFLLAALGFAQGLSGFALLSCGVALAAQEGVLAGATAGLFAGAFFSTLPLRYAWVSALSLALLGGLVGRFMRPAAGFAGGVGLIFVSVGIEAAFCVDFARADLLSLLRAFSLQATAPAVGFVSLFFARMLFRRKRYA